MKTVTYKKFLEFEPRLLEDMGGAERIKAYFDRFGGRMSALDILNLDDISTYVKLGVVLRKEFIPTPILHEFACVCAEYVSTLIDGPDSRSIEDMEARRAWIHSEAPDEAYAAARDAVYCAGYSADKYADWAATRYRCVTSREAARAAARAAAARAAAREAQVAYLIMALEGEDGEGSAKCEAQVTYSIMPSEGKMKTVTYEEFLEFDLSGLEEGDGERIKAYFDRFGGSVSALDILSLNDASEGDRLWLVLREEFIPAPILHEFACVCAEYALTLVNNPDPCSIKAVEVKRAWLHGEATDKELAAARNDARLAARVWAAGDDAWAVSFNARHAAWAAAGDVASDAARAAACYASDAAWEAARGDSRDTASDAAREAQVAYLIMTLEEEK